MKTRNNQRKEGAMAMKEVAGPNGSLILTEVPDERVFSTRKVVKAAMGLGVWETVKAFLIERGYWGLFLVTKDFKGSDPDFVAGKAAIKELLGWTEEKIDSVLADCMLED